MHGGVRTRQTVTACGNCPLAEAEEGLGQPGPLPTPADRLRRLRRQSGWWERVREREGWQHRKRAP